MINTTPILPFAKSVPPPPPLILLLRNSDLILESLPTLLAYEDLPLRHTTHSESNHASTPFELRTGQARAESLAITAAMDEALSTMDNWSSQALSSASSSASSSPASSSPTPMDNASPSHLSFVPPTPRSTPAPKPRPTTVRVSKIRKPRPKGAGRYNLTDIVELETGLLEKIKDDVRKLMYKHLDTSICFSSQDKDKVDMIRKQIVSKYTIIDDYSGAWPVDHILMNLLKYTSSHNKVKTLREATAMIKQAI